MHKYKCDGFVIYEGLLITPLRKAILITGTIECSGGLKVEVQKRLDILDQEDRNPLVQTVSYSYNVFLTGVGNVFRYDSPHKDHNQQHHVHRYDVLNAGNTVAVTYIGDEENIPTLG
ncbi:MAG: hypothetical protein HGB22_10460 [Chlorobiaceae bacterium]|nr:hypothetical protein [Chlorobiaceae bacterium]